MEWVQTKPFNRLRFIFDSKLSLANALDKVCDVHRSGATYYLNEPLPYGGLPDRAVTCKDLRGFVNRVSNVLVAAGLKRFDRVAIYKTESPDYFFLGLAVIRAGGISVPVHPGMPLTDLSNYLAHVGARFVITDPKTFGGGMGQLQATGLALEKWIFTSSPPPDVSVPHVALEAQLPSASAEFEPVKLARDADVLIVHTSGTTGFPKGVLCGNNGIMQALRTNLMIQPFTRKNRGLLVGPYNHYASHLGLLTALVGAAPAWLHNTFDAEAVLRTIEAERINVYVGFPDTYLKMYNHGLERYDLSSMRAWMAAADASHEVHVRAFTRKGALFRLFGRPLMRSVFADAWGTSEIGFFGLARYSLSTTRRFGRCIGRPSPIGFGPRVKIADEHGRSLPPGQIGRFMVRGPTLFKGYWNAHDRLHGVLIDGWWWTGDVGYRDRLGRFYQLDRVTDVIEAGERRIYTLPIEEQLLKLADVGEAVVVGVPRKDGRAAPIAIVSPLPGKSIDSEAFLVAANGRLKVDNQLDRVVVVEEKGIPRGLTGKVLKRQLRERYANLLTGDHAAHRAATSSRTTHASPN